MKGNYGFLAGMWNRVSVCVVCFQEQRAVDSGMVAGSVSLVAPELREGEPPSPTSDMYAFGGLMFWVG